MKTFKGAKEFDVFVINGLMNCIKHIYKMLINRGIHCFLSVAKYELVYEEVFENIIFNYL
jgi:hypothetical protein